MKLLVLYHDGHEERCHRVLNSTGVDTDRINPFSPSEFGLDDDCSILAVIEVADDSDPNVYDSDGDEFPTSYS